MNKIEEIYHNYSFWVKSSLSFIIIVDTIALRLNTQVVPFVILQYTWSISAVLMLILCIIGASPYIGYFKEMSFRKNSKQMVLNPNLIQLAEKMGIECSSFYLVENWNGASMYCDALSIGEILKSKLTEQELEAIVAHEFTHKIHEITHLILLFVGCFLSWIIAVLLGLGLPSIMYKVLLLSCVYLFVPQFCWFRELDCDENAIKYADKKDLQSGLIKYGEGRIHKYGFLHPSIAFRIADFKRIEKIWIRVFSSSKNRH
ncbi:MAG: M48 family metalloprotease [Candidatus Bathyarchaeota archaeon]|nr:M48 family metalloprotease [Candidatus Bathyarchaeota archaeon]